jgi:putative transposase
MKQRRYTEDQIVEILGEVESGKPVTEVARVHGISETTIHRWRKKYGGMGRSELKRLKELESENSRLRRIVGQQAEGSSANGLRVVYGLASARRTLADASDGRSQGPRPCEVAQLHVGVYYRYFQW